MAKFNYNLLELDVNKLFEEHKIEDIIEINKQFENEIEKKRVELRSMVGDRYKDILAASDAIKNMKAISEDIVCNIDSISNGCLKLIESTTGQNKTETIINGNKLEERTAAAQIRLAIVLNEHIWLALDEENYCLATQFYLLAQHLYTGLSLMKSEFLSKLPIIKRTEDVANSLKSRILKKIKVTLELAELNTDEMSSNLAALLLLENQTNIELLSTFVEHRKHALKTVTEASHPSVRAQVSAMVKCLINTVHLLHGCFITSSTSGKGLVGQQLDAITNSSASYTLSKVLLPNSPLLLYIPDVISEFRPKLTTTFTILTDNDRKYVVHEWLNVTSYIVKNGLEKSLYLITTAKGLHIIREDAHKIALPDDWDNICSEIGLPKNFNIWSCYFQSLFTKKAETLITKKLGSIVEDICSDIYNCMSNIENLKKSEKNLQLFTWNEEVTDVSRQQNEHLGLSMKTKGFPPVVVDLCEKLDLKYSKLIEDVFFYLYGKEYNSSSDIKSSRFILNDTEFNKKFIDHQKLENHLQMECYMQTSKLIDYLTNLITSETDNKVTKALMCARFTLAVTLFCPNFHKCCSFNGKSSEWEKICNNFHNCSINFWNIWLENCLKLLTNNCDKLLDKIDINVMLTLLPRWDIIEIQEQTEDKVFKSQIRIPCQPSLALQNLITSLTDSLNYILPHTLPKKVHQQFIEKCVQKILDKYDTLTKNQLNQTQALQFLFDVKFITTFCITRENVQLISKSQEVCDKLRSQVDPFDLDVFYSYLQGNVKRYVLQSQTILGCLLPSLGQLANLGVSEKTKEPTKADPSVLALSIPSTTSWFQLLPVTIPAQKNVTTVLKDPKVTSSKQQTRTPKKSHDPAATVKSGAAALFGGLTTDWFS